MYTMYKNAMHYQGIQRPTCVSDIFQITGVQNQGFRERAQRTSKQQSKNLTTFNCTLIYRFYFSSCSILIGTSSNIIIWQLACTCHVSDTNCCTVILPKNLYSKEQ